ncbi:MAG: hypothetical protein ACE5EF_11080, partial [Dehalococcoidia bacterium]
SWFHSLWLRSATGWLVLSAGAGILAAMRGTQGVAHVEDSQFVAEAFIRGFLASAIVGIALRAFAGHLGLPPVGRPAQATAMIGINLASAGWLAGSGAFGMTQIAALQRASDLLFAASLLYITYSLGVLRAFQFDWKLPRYTLLLPWAWAGAVVYAVALGVAALSPGWDGRTLYETGALRHLFLLGFMAPLMVAMAHIVLARFGTGELLAPRPLLAAFLLLQSAWPLRVIPPLVSDPPNEVARTVMAVAGALTAAGLLFLAVAAIRTGRALRRRSRWSALPSLLSQT